MNKVTIVLIALMMMALVVVMAPRILAMNHGKILRNIAIWLAVFLALGLVYQNFGPASKHPLFQGPSFMARQPEENAAPKPSDRDLDKVPGDHNFTPPAE